MISLVKLSIKDVSKVFTDDNGQKIEAVKDVCVEVKDKEFVAIVGPSGCGKTTLLKIVAGLIKPTEGNVFLDGKAVSQPSQDRGMVFQHPASFPWLSVVENVEFGLKTHGMDKKNRRQIAEQLIDQVGLTGFENAYIKSLSGGMKQRVAIATVLANNPEILLMDEPFSALDNQTRSLMQELILNIWQESTKTVLFVTHDIEESIFLADRVYIMSAKPGKIKDVIKINLPRPRTPDMKLSAEFLKIKKHISYIIRGEAIKAAQVKLKEIRPNALKIGLHIWPGVMPFYLADGLNLYRKHGLEVELLSQEKDDDRISALQNKEVDVLTLTADAAVLAQEKLPDIQIFLCPNKSKGGDALLVNKNIKSIKDLKGKTIAVEKGWVGHFFLLYLLDKYNIMANEVSIIYMKGSDIGAALIAEKAEAAVLWEPWLTQARELSGANILVSTKEEQVIIDVLVTTKEILNQRPEHIKKLVRVWFDCLRDIQNNPNKASKLMAVSLGVTPKELKEQIKTFEFLDLNSNKKLLGTKNKEGTLVPLLENMADIWLKNEIIKNRANGEKLTNSTFL